MGTGVRYVVDMTWYVSTMYGYVWVSGYDDDDDVDDDGVYDDGNDDDEWVGSVRMCGLRVGDSGYGLRDVMSGYECGMVYDDVCAGMYAPR